MQKMRTMEELSVACGISRPTLSKYFHNPASVRTSTRARIEDALSVFDYRPNLFAINQNRERPKTIGIVVPQMTDPFYAELVREIELRCIDAGFWPIVLSSHGSPDLEARALGTLRSLRLAGAILALLGNEARDDAVSRLAETIPIVLLDSRRDTELPFVGTDNAHSIALIVEYLHRSGEHPCFLEMPSVNANAEERREGYRRAMEEVGAEPILLAPSTHGWDFEEIGYRSAEAVMNDGGFPTRTVLCANDRLAIGVLAAACARNVRVGVEEGCQLRVAGHDDHPMARYTCPPLTTVAQNFEQLAAQSLDLLLARVEGPERPGGERIQERRLKGSLVLRRSA
ncbi:LacI family DNA-binding transcriptional regulator [Pararhizobium mangrovi]|uniref:LacI family transcriptional regulator n=1 Tax=Pararhizobium mangrovi TaxID=2590452 RepID=A0A506U8N6_9HYPH|nr:LacI family DNA-binding transcriptional regulator [Pararhizobium mangrovi]TPW30260.1 LacI family transcriptional regulator [Pararhizobium mangrovi]